MIEKRFVLFCCLRPTRSLQYNQRFVFSCVHNRVTQIPIMPLNGYILRCFFIDGLSTESYTQTHTHRLGRADVTSRIILVLKKKKRRGNVCYTKPGFYVAVHTLLYLFESSKQFRYISVTAHWKFQQLVSS